MFSCENCKTKFTYIDIFKSQFTSKITCLNCSEKYLLKSRYKLITLILLILPTSFIIYLVNIKPFSNIARIIIFYLVWYLFVTLTVPFFYKFQK